MLGVLLQSLVQIQAVLADFYLYGLPEEGKVDPYSESDDDEWHSPSQVQVRVPLLLANSTELSGSKEQRPLPPNHHPLLTWRNSACVKCAAALRLHNFPHSFTFMYNRVMRTEKA